MRTFTCEGCGRVIETEHPEEEAWAEAAQNGFSNVPREEMASVCDDCYEEAMRAGFIQ